MNIHTALIELTHLPPLTIRKTTGLMGRGRGRRGDLMVPLLIILNSQE